LALLREPRKAENRLFPAFSREKPGKTAKILWKRGFSH
jgi:hypothetical protein